MPFLADLNNETRFNLSSQLNKHIAPRPLGHLRMQVRYWTPLWRCRLNLVDAIVMQLYRDTDAWKKQP